MALRTYNLKIKAKTWKRDSYGLFDYENHFFNSQNITSSRQGGLIRSVHQISYANLNSYLEKKSRKDQTEVGIDENLFNVVEGPDGITIAAEASNDEDPNQLWTVIERGEASKGYALKVNDVIKLGRVIFRITQIKVADDSQKNRVSKRSILDSIRDHMKTDTEELIISMAQGSEIAKTGKSSNAGNLCKICLYDKSEEENDPLISPCKCSGSVKYVHLKCIQNWVKSKLNMQQNRNILTILWKNLYCELCKEKMPISFTQNGENMYLIPFDDKITGSYVMMESFSKERDSTGIHLIDLSSNHNFKIGRGHDCDLKISDISVSRVHAVFVVSKGKLYLKDNESKFGTLVLKKSPLLLNSENMKSDWFQCGRTLFRFSLKKPWLAYIPCFSSMFSYHKSVPAISQDQHQTIDGFDDTRARLPSDEDISHR